MTNEELKNAFWSRVPVIAHIVNLGDIEYENISAITYRFNRKGHFIVSAELIDRKSNTSVSIVEAKHIRLKEN